VNFIPNSERGASSVPVGCLPHAFLQLIVCRSAVHCLKSQRAVLLSQDTQREGPFARTHTLIVAFTSPICLLYWLGTCVNFILNTEWSVALFLSVVCPMLFCNAEERYISYAFLRQSRAQHGNLKVDLRNDFTTSSN
jgi:hypothetical protein